MYILDYKLVRLLIGCTSMMNEKSRGFYLRVALIKIKYMRDKTFIRGLR